MTEPADFIDAALRYEVSPYSWPSAEPDGLRRYGTSIGAIRGTIRDALKRYPGMTHDEVTALSSELWAGPVLERRQAAVVLLQANVAALVVNDLTRIEGFVRSAGFPALVDQLLSDVVEPMIARLHATSSAKIHTVIGRWRTDPDPAVRFAGERINGIYS